MFFPYNTRLLEKLCINNNQTLVPKSEINYKSLIDSLDSALCIFSTILSHPNTQLQSHSQYYLLNLQIFFFFFLTIINVILGFLQPFFELLLRGVYESGRVKCCYFIYYALSIHTSIFVSAILQITCPNVLCR